MNTAAAIPTDEDTAMIKALADALIDTVEGQLAAGWSQQGVWEACRDHVCENFGFPLRAAANLTRMIFCVVADRLGAESPYTRDEIDALYELTKADIAVAA